MAYEFKARDVYDFANSIGAETHEKGGELFFKFCPRCHGGDHRDKDTFSVNLETGAFKCFRSSCGYQGHFVELCRDFNYPLDFGEKRVYRKLPQREITVRDGAVEYMASRGIGAEVCNRYFITTQTDNKNVLVFPFFDENGILQFIKYRNANHKKGDKSAKEWCEKNTKPILFGMKQCVNFGTLIITEGQIDSLSVAEAGFNNAVSVPTGATGFTWLQNCWEWICQFESIICFGDFEKGKMTLLDTLVSRLPQTVKAVREQDYLGEKDANDILRKYGKSAIRTAIENAEPPKLSNVKDLSTVAAVDINELPKIKTNVAEIDGLIGGLICGQVVLLTGQRGNGKSTFMSQLVCEALDQGKNVFVYSGELADYHFKRWLDFQLAGSNHVLERVNEYNDKMYYLSKETVESLNSWYAGRAYIYDNNYVPDDMSEIESITKTVVKVIKQYGVSLVCIDNLMTAMDVITQHDNLYLAQSNFVGELKKIAVRYNVVIVLVAHPRKTNGDFTNDDVSGSSDITNKVDVVMSYKRAAEEETDHESELSITKNRLFGKYASGKNAIKLHYSEKTKRVFSMNAKPRHYGWELAGEPVFTDLEDVGLDELPF